VRSIQIYTYCMRAGIALLGHLYLCRYYFSLSRRLVAEFSRLRAGSVGFVVKKSGIGVGFSPSTSSLYFPISIDPQNLHTHVIHFFLICKTNARAKLAKTGTRSALFQISCYLCCSVVICVVPCTLCL
jgi:hypothetical protein